MEWYISVLKKYAVFSGRARRKEYWFFILFNFIFGSVLGLLTLSPIGNFFLIISFVYSLALFIPSLAVSVRRLHDIDRSGFSLFLVYIPVVGIIILLTFLIRDGVPDENEYGPNPKTVPEENSTKERKNVIRLLIPFLVILGVLSMVLFYYFGFKNMSNTEQFQIMNISNNEYYLNVVSKKNITLFSLKRNEQIDGIKYTYICKSGKHRLKGIMLIFDCKRDDNVDIAFKLRTIFDEFKITDENDNIIWDMDDENMEKITRTEAPFHVVFWNITIK